MIGGVAVVPGALALLPTYAGAHDMLAGLRAAAVEAVEDVVSDAGRIVLVTATDREPRHTGPSIGQRVGGVLLDGRAHASLEVPWNAVTSECLAAGAKLVAEQDGFDSTAIVFVADGSACRSIKAPGHFDERAESFDENSVSALRRADDAALAALDLDLAAELLAHGRAPLQVLAGLMAATGRRGGTWVCDSLEQSDPFGVLYVIARLTQRSEADRAPRHTGPSWT